MATRTDYEYIVIGCGGVGSAALYWLSKKLGSGVLGLEQFKLGHENGGSQDYSRIIRMFYHDEKYTKLTPHTYKAWEEVEKESGIQLVYRTGGLDLAEHNSSRHKVLDEYAQAMDQQNIPYERWSGRELRGRFPQFTVPDNMSVLYQKDGGIVDAAMGNAVHLQLAQARGAMVIDQCPVTRLEIKGPAAMVNVVTPRGVFRCKKVIVTSGAWINHVLGSVGVHIPVNVTQEQITYFATPNLKQFTKQNFPTYIYHGDEKDIYGLPIHGNSGSKIGIDAGGNTVTADSRTFHPDPVREQIVIDWMSKFLPGALGPIISTKTCLYTMTKDRDFVIDSLADNNMPQVLVCCGAGHVYKFASFFGKVLSEMAVDGRSQYDIHPFRFNRPAVTDPNFKPTYIMGLKEKAKL